MRVSTGFALSAAMLLALSIGAKLLGSQPHVVHAAVTTGYQFTSTPGGDYVVGPAGTISFCSATGQLAGSAIVPIGTCSAYSAIKLTPTTDVWIANLVGSSTTIMFDDTTSGHVVQCVASALTNGSIILTCKSLGTVTA